MFHSLSASIGLPEPALRFFVTLLASYPVAAFFRAAFLKPSISSFQRNLAVAFFGLTLSFVFNQGTIIHSLATVVLTYFAYTLLSNRTHIAIAISIINVAYLLLGYKYASSDEYDINWLTPQCILCLRLMGLGMDIMDGKQRPGPPEKASSQGTQKGQHHDLSSTNSTPRLNLAFDDDCPLSEKPSFIELIGYSFFFSSFLTGPQFSFSLYRKFLKMSRFEKPDAKGKVTVVIPSATTYALKALVIGLLYTALQQWLGAKFPTSYATTQEFGQLPFVKKMVYFWISGKMTLTKYLAVWTISDGALALSGISFNGYHPATRKPLWNGLVNVELWAYESAMSLTRIIGSFNINTNQWVKRYIFKRLRFLNSKNLSSLGSLLFLAIWHGTHPGYFLVFFLEFIDMEAERRFKILFDPIYQHLTPSKSSLVKRLFLNPIMSVFSYFWTTITLYYAAVGFDLLAYSKVMAAWGNVNYICHVSVLLIFLTDISLGKQIRRAFSPKATEKKSQ